MGAAMPIISIIGKDPAIAVDGTSSVQRGYFERRINNTTNKSVTPKTNSAQSMVFDHLNPLAKDQTASMAIRPVVTSPIPELINSLGPIPEVATKKKIAPSILHSCPAARYLKEILSNIVLKFLFVNSSNVIPTGNIRPSTNFGKRSSTP